MIRAGIYGATGYTGVELITLLHSHPEVQVAFATARSAAGQQLRDVFPTLLDMPLIHPDDADPSQADVVFCCLPHAASAPIVRHAMDAGARVIDLSADFRLRDPAEYARIYGKGDPHPEPELLTQAVYGLPELYRARIKDTQLVANPGCFPITAILPLHALIQAGLLADQHVIVDSKTGVSGAGRTLSLRTHFSESHENFSAYNIGRKHRHIAEIEQETGTSVLFSPHLLPVVRGILSTIYVTITPGTSQAALEQAFALYADEPFTHVLPDNRLPELRHVVGNNHCVIGMEPVDLEAGRIILVSVEDNLLKGASGQAVQNMNLLFGLDETLGLC